MSVSTARVLCETLAEFASGDAKATAQRILDEWDAPSSSAIRMREKRRRDRDVVTSGDVRVTSPPTSPDVTTNVTVTSGVTLEAPKGPSLISRSSDPGRSERGDSAFSLTPSDVGGDMHGSDAPKRDRVRHRYPETLAPNPDDAAAFTAFCQRWELDPRDAVVVACIGHHYGKGTKWRDWKWAVKNWRKRERTNGTNGHPPRGGGAARFVQPAGGDWKTGEAERKADEIP